jgi:hypothetical protein
MSLYSDAVAVVLVADHVSVDPSGRIHALGLAFNIVSLGPASLTPPCTVLAVVDVPRRHVGVQAALGLELRDDTLGQVVALPGPSGSGEALRVQQLVTFNPPNVAGAYLTPDLPCRAQMVLAFQNGLPLTPGHTYTWRLEVDGQARPDWRASFHVVGPAPSPVFGGPTGPTPTDFPSLDGLDS